MSERGDIWYTADPVSAKKLYIYLKYLARGWQYFDHLEPSGSDPELIVNYAGMVTLIYRCDDSDLHVEFNTDRPTEYLWTKMSKDTIPMVLDAGYGNLPE